MRRPPTRNLSKLALHSAVVGWAFLLGCAGVGLAHADSKTEVNALIERGQELNLAGDHDGAALIFAKVREIAPENPAGPVHQVATLYWRQIFDEADTRYDDEIIKLCGEAIQPSVARIEVDEADAKAHYYMGVALIDLARIHGYRGRYREAAREANLLANRPNTNRLVEGRGNVARIWQARALVQLGEPERALQILTRVPEGSASLPSWGRAWSQLTRAQAYDVMGKREQALVNYGAVLALKGGPFDSDRARALAKSGLESPLAIDRPDVTSGPHSITH